MESDGILESCGVQWNPVESNGIRGNPEFQDFALLPEQNKSVLFWERVLWNLRESYGFQENPMESQGILRNPREFQRILGIQENSEFQDSALSPLTFTPTLNSLNSGIGRNQMEFRELLGIGRNWFLEFWNCVESDKRNSWNQMELDGTDSGGGTDSEMFNIAEQDDCSVNIILYRFLS